MAEFRAVIEKLRCFVSTPDYNWVRGCWYWAIPRLLDHGLIPVIDVSTRSGFLKPSTNLNRPVRLVRFWLLEEFETQIEHDEKCMDVMEWEASSTS